MWCLRPLRRHKIVASPLVWDQWIWYTRCLSQTTWGTTIRIHYTLMWKIDCRDEWGALWLFTQPFIQTQIKENIKAPRHWPLCAEFTGTGEFTAQRASYAENVPVWWRHHGCSLVWNRLIHVAGINLPQSGCHGLFYHVHIKHILKFKHNDTSLSPLASLYSSK